MMLKHNIEQHLVDDLDKKMVFIAGPRQVGKTTLGKRIINAKNGIYLLYDNNDDRRKIFKKEYNKDAWVCLDEFHKYQRWKSYLKGVYDKYRETLHILLTGSARLDIYQKSGDSLLGRYYLYHLHPFTLAELNKKKISLPEDIHAPVKNRRGLDELIHFGGFPEPFISQSEQEHRRWSNQRRALLVREDLRELSDIQLVSIVENLMVLLPERIGSLFSYTSLSQDLNVSVPTIQSWLSVFEKLYIVYKIQPYSKQITRSIRKRPKYYLWDWSQLDNIGKRFENLVASHLFKAVTLWTDLGLANCGLYYIHTRDGKEVDFLVQKDNRPWFLVEAKVSDNHFGKNLRYFSELLGIPGIQVVLDSHIYKKEAHLSIISAEWWLGHLE
ncbi:MAG: ATP-binding protein [Spirochaetales bacterium]|nr:ATP-binding protein [Spirochaetales bacterium]